MKDGNFITIQSFMITDLHLKGNELLIYAIIYGFSQIDNQRFTGSLNYLAEWTNSTKQGVIKNLKSLIEKGYIEKQERIINGVKFCEYVSKFNSGKQSLTGGIKQSLPNNIDNNNIIKDNKDINIFITESGHFDYQKIIDLFNAICISLPQVRIISDNRRKAIRRANKDIKGEWEQFFHKIENSDFLSGRNGQWKASFDWCIQPRNLIKILEGNYDNQIKQNKFIDGLKKYMQE